MMGWCWHRWAKWVDIPLVLTYVGGDDVTEPAQERRCAKCNKRIIRRVV